MRLTAKAQHKALGREFKVMEIDLVAQRVKCEGKVGRQYCVLCEQVGASECLIPWFRIEDVELEIQDDGKVLK